MYNILMPCAVMLYRTVNCCIVVAVLLHILKKYDYRIQCYHLLLYFTKQPFSQYT